MNRLYFDVETLDLFDTAHRQPADLHFGIAVSFEPEREPSRQWTYYSIARAFDLYRAMCNADQVIGWNCAAFDIPVVTAQLGREFSPDAFKPKEWKPAQVIDLMAQIRDTTGRWYKLEVIAQANLRRGKISDGLTAVQWLNSGDEDLVSQAMEYCREDVQLTYDLHQILLSGQPLILPGRERPGEQQTIEWRM